MHLHQPPPSRPTHVTLLLMHQEAPSRPTHVTLLLMHQEAPSRPTHVTLHLEHQGPLQPVSLLSHQRSRLCPYTQLPAAEVYSATPETYVQSRWGENDASCEKDAVEEGSPRCATALFYEAVSPSQCVVTRSIVQEADVNNLDIRHDKHQT